MAKITIVCGCGKAGHLTSEDERIEAGWDFYKDVRGEEWLCPKCADRLLEKNMGILLGRRTA